MLVSSPTAAPPNEVRIRQAPVAERPHRAPACKRVRIMHITKFLDGFKFDPEARRVMGVAFEMTCAALRYTKRPDVAHEAVADRIIELAKNGVRNPDRLCERVLDDLRKLPPHL
jgi:hypothetical protein